MKKIIIDLDGTIALKKDDQGYRDARPDQELIGRLHEYRNLGYEICIHTARNMRTHAGNIGKINALTLPIMLDWLHEHSVPYDEIVVGKPWCGPEGFYVDDRSVRPSEFKALSSDDLNRLLAKPDQSNG